MKKVSEPAAQDFIACNPSIFYRAFVNIESKCEVVISNMAETFNAYIINARTRHLISMLEEIRSALMQRIVLKNKEAVKWGETSTICPRVMKRLEEEKEMAANCEPIPSSSTLFQVTHRIDTLNVDLENKSCTCRKWDLTGVPCFHVISAIFFMHEEAESYVHDQFKLEAHKLAYSGSIRPCEGERHWPKVNFPMDPPPIKIGLGRPRKNRRKDPYESPSKLGKLTKHGTIMSCSICKSTSHNKHKCPDKDKIVEPPPKRRVGRPRKSGEGSSNPTSTAEYQPTAQPSRLGRGGRVIRTGRGSGITGRGGGRGSEIASRGGGRGSETAGRSGGRGAGANGAMGGVGVNGTASRGGGRGAGATGTVSGVGVFGTARRGGGRGARATGSFAYGRGGGRGVVATRGRGGGKGSTRNWVPQGFGIFIDQSGNHFTNTPRCSKDSSSVRSPST